MRQKILLLISDFYTFIPKYKDWYIHEAKLFAKSAGIELFDFQLSGILQVAGQAMSTYLKGEQFFSMWDQLMLVMLDSISLGPLLVRIALVEEQCPRRNYEQTKDVHDCEFFQ